jgi:hypothetical protein
VVFDYEAAWADLLALLESEARPNWGARQLRDEMGRILARRRVNEAGAAQWLRLYGVELDRRIFHQQRDAGPTVSPDLVPGDEVLPGPDRATEEVTDEQYHRAAVG